MYGQWFLVVEADGTCSSCAHLGRRILLWHMDYNNNSNNNNSNNITFVIGLVLTLDSAVVLLASIALISLCALQCACYADGKMSVYSTSTNNYLRYWSWS